MVRILGLDYGSRKLGFAIGDPTETIATPLQVTRVQSDDEALRVVEQVCLETRAGKVVVGMPINMNGSKGPQAQHVARFVDQLSHRLKIPVETWDERLTTKSAEDVLIEAGTRRERRKEVIDKLAAQIMLQNYLDAHAPPAEPLAP